MQMCYQNWYSNKMQNDPKPFDTKVCFLESDNGFSQIFCNCINVYVDEIFSQHNQAFSLSQNVKQKSENRLKKK